MIRMNGIHNIKVLTNKIENADFEAYSEVGRRDDYLLILFQSRISFSYDGKEFFQAPKNSLIVFDPYRTHSYKSADSKFVNSFMAFQCDSEWLNQFGFPLHSLFTIDEEYADKILSTLDRMSFVLNTDYDLPSRDKIPSMAENIFRLVGKAYRDAVSHMPDANSKLAIFSEIRNRMIKDPISYTIGMMARESGYTPTYFGIIYKKYFGIQPVKDRNRHIVDVVKNYLQTTNFSIETIAERCHIDSVPYLITLFKSFENITPHQYRLKFQADSQKKKE